MFGQRHCVCDDTQYMHGAILRGDNLDLERVCNRRCNLRWGDTFDCVMAPCSAMTGVGNNTVWAPSTNSARSLGREFPSSPPLAASLSSIYYLVNSWLIIQLWLVTWNDLDLKSPCVLHDHWRLKHGDHLEESTVMWKLIYRDSLLQECKDETAARSLFVAKPDHESV